jgi:serine phosphatase RsbU (regulator of sigma subunit)/CBS domain-containing protein
MAEPFLSVRQFMQPEPVVVPPECPLRDVLALMNQFRIGAVVVVAPDRSLLGIFTERDLLRRVAEADVGWRDQPVEQWMTPRPHAVGPDLGWEEVTALMDHLRVRHLPVTEAGRVIGIISTRLLMGRRAEYLNRQVEDRTRDLRQANDELMARDADLRYNLRAAGRFQARLLLPHAPPDDWPELRWGIHFAPLDHLGGDYYDVAHPDPDRLGFLIADASGHSIAAMMVAIISRTAFAEVAHTTTSPGAVLTAMNERLQGLADERFVTAFYGVLDRRTRVLTYANAGHPYPLRRVAATGEVQPLTAQGFMLGIMPGEQYREKSMQLSPGDRLCFYTDGLIEARNEIGETFGVERLTGCLASHGSEPSARLTDHILTCQRTFRGTHALSDDVTLVVAEFAAP